MTPPRSVREWLYENWNREDWEVFANEKWENKPYSPAVPMSDDWGIMRHLINSYQLRDGIYEVAATPKTILTDETGQFLYDKNWIVDGKVIEILFQKAHNGSHIEAMRIYDYLLFENALKSTDFIPCHEFLSIVGIEPTEDGYIHFQKVYQRYLKWLHETTGLSIELATTGVGYYRKRVSLKINDA